MRYFHKIYLFITFILFYIKNLIWANIYIAYDILTPTSLQTPGFIWIPLRTESKLGILLLCNLISMTPGTLTVDLCEERNAILVHYLYNTNNRIESELEIIQNKIITLLK